MNTTRLTTEQAMRLRDKYFDGATTEAEEALLRHFLTTAEGQASELDDLRAVMSFAAMARAKRRPTARKRVFRYAAAAATVAAVAIGSIVALGPTGNSHDDLCYAYINGKRITDEDIVMEHMHSALLSMNTTGNDIEAQLSDMFGTLDEE